MADAGVPAEDDRVEAIEGEMIGMPPIRARHAACVDDWASGSPCAYWG
jgi:hypothetical protein